MITPEMWEEMDGQECVDMAALAAIGMLMGATRYTWEAVRNEVVEILKSDILSDEGRSEFNKQPTK